MTPAQNTAAYIQGFEDGKRVAQVEIKRELAQRTWVGLNGYQQKELMAMTAREAVFATEAKLKELNHETSQAICLC